MVMWKYLPDVTRITIVSKNGVEFERYNLYDGIEVHLQDDGRTLKIFPLREEFNNEA